MIIDGRAIAEKIIGRLGERKPPAKILAAVLVGNDSASLSFLLQKKKVALQLGVDFRIYRWSAAITGKELARRVKALDFRRDVAAIIIQLPLPKKFNQPEIIDIISSRKDVDGLTRRAKVLPPTVGALKQILSDNKFNLKGKKVLIIGRGFLVGRPISEWLRNKAVSVSVLGRGEVNVQNLKDADLVVTGVGKAGLIRGEYIKKGAVLIDFGYAFKNGKAVGDIDFESCKRKASYITPTPGGTGPMVVAQLFENFYKLTKRYYLFGFNV